MMKKAPLENTLFILFLIATSLFYFLGLAEVPFHPDESTQIFMSGDLEHFIEKPASLFWHTDKAADLRQRYRLLDAPVTRWMIGAGRILAGQSAPGVDWDWSRTWAENEASGALPDARALLIARLAVTWLFPGSLALIYTIGRLAGGRVTAWSAALFFATNALVLLHTRRAMAESALVFFSLLALWAIVRLRTRLWLIALPLVLAVNSKQSSVALLAPATASILWHATLRTRHILQKNVILSAAIFLLVTALLNPYLWRQPITALRTALDARMTFTSIQTDYLSDTGYGIATTSMADRATGLIAQTFTTPPAIRDVSNYAHAGMPWQYFNNPMHSLLRDLPGALILLTLTLVGMAIAAYRVIKNSTSNRRTLALLLIATLAQALTLFGMFEIVFQRYYLMLAVINCLWAGYALQCGWDALAAFRSRGGKRGDSYTAARPS